MQRIHKQYEITDDRGWLDFATIHGWLTETYWAAGITRPKVEKAARHSAVVVGAYRHEASVDNASAKGSPKQVGYCRVVSDFTRFAWVADVIVDPAQRGQGLGQAMVKFMLEHPELADVHNWLLGTKDAQGVYEKVGFKVSDEPSRLMQLRRPQVL